MTMSTLQSCTSDTRDWLTANIKLKLTDSKTEIFIAESLYNLKNQPDLRISEGKKKCYVHLIQPKILRTFCNINMIMSTH